MSQNAPVLVPPKGFPAKRSNPGAADWIGPLQDNTTDEQYACQVENLAEALGAGVSSFNTRTGAVTLEESDVSTALGGPPGTATAVAGAATLNKYAGEVTSEALVAATTYALTLSNSLIVVGSIVLVNVTESTGAAGVTLLSKAITAGQIVIDVSMAALTGTLKFDFIIAN
jgi:hypothetical protein